MKSQSTGLETPSLFKNASQNFTQTVRTKTHQRLQRYSGRRKVRNNRVESRVAKSTLWDRVQRSSNQKSKQNRSQLSPEKEFQIEELVLRDADLDLLMNRFHLNEALTTLIYLLPPERGAKFRFNKSSETGSSKCPGSLRYDNGSCGSLKALGNLRSVSAFQRLERNVGQRVGLRVEAVARLLSRLAQRRKLDGMHGLKAALNCPAIIA